MAAPGDSRELLASVGYSGGIVGSVEQMTDAIGRFGAAGDDEVRLGLIPDSPSQLEVIGEVVARL